MSDIEINLLKERILEYRPNPQHFNKTNDFGGLKEQMPILIGLGVALLSLLGVNGLGWFLNTQNQETENHIAQLNTQLAAFRGEKAKLENIQQELKKINDENRAIVNVFTQVESISAILQDLGDQMPRGTVLNSIEFSDQIASNENSGTQINLSGSAKGFDDVNDLLLTLQRSAFFNPQTLKIEKAELSDISLAFNKPKNLPRGVSWKQDQNTLTVKTPKDVSTIKVPNKEVIYTISAQLSPLAQNNLLEQLEQKGASGLVTRLKTLKKEGLIQP
jgi:type IV pilus assembly protein PilN